MQQSRNMFNLEISTYVKDVKLPSSNGIKIKKEHAAKELLFDNEIEHNNSKNIKLEKKDS